MLALIGDLGQPAACLRVDIGQVREGAQGPEILPNVTDRPLHFSFFPSCRYMTGARNEMKLAREGEETRVESHQVAFVFGDGSGEIIKPDFLADPTQGLKGMDVAAGEGLEA